MCCWEPVPSAMSAAAAAAMGAGSAVAAAVGAKGRQPSGFCLIQQLLMVSGLQVEAPGIGCAHFAVLAHPLQLWPGLDKGDYRGVVGLDKTWQWVLMLQPAKPQDVGLTLGEEHMRPVVSRMP